MPYLCYDGFINREPEKPFCSGETGAGRVDNREVINDVLVNLFNEILRLEEEAIITDKYKDISNNDMHIIEAVGLGGGNMSSIAAKLKITVGSLTTSMNSLVKKGYVKRERSEKDRRVVFIQLTNKGRMAYHHHAEFHRQMTGLPIHKLVWRGSYKSLECCSVCPQSIIQALCPILSTGNNSPFQDSFKFSIRDFSLPICLWMIRSCHFVANSISDHSRV